MSSSGRPTSRTQALLQAVAGLLQLPLAELPRVALMFSYSLLAVGAFIVGRILQDALFLTLPRAQGKDLILTFIGISAVVVSATTFVYSRLAHTKRRDQMIILINAVLAAFTMVLYLLLLILPQSFQFRIIQLNYIFVEVMGSLQVILFWTLASELFNPRSARRSFAIIGGGAVLANLLAFLVRPAVVLLGGAHHLMLLLVMMLLLCLAVVRLIGHQNEHQLEQLMLQKQEQARKKDEPRRYGTQQESLWNNRHLLSIAIMIFVTFAAATIINYLFKATNADHFGSDRNGLANFLSMFYGYSGLLACVVQFTLANRILQHAGIRAALLLLPIALLMGTSLLALAPVLLSALWAATLTKGSENVLRYTIYEVSMNLLYVPLDSKIRARAKAFIDGILKPMAIALSALLCALLAGYGWKEKHFAWIVLGLLAVWLRMVFWAHKEYIETLISSMRTRRLDLVGRNLTIQDEGALKELREVLRSGTSEQVLHALELLQHVNQGSWQEELLGLLNHEDERVKIHALQALMERPDLQIKADLESSYAVMERQGGGIGERLMPLLEREEGEVKAQAIETICAVMQEDAIEKIIPCLLDQSAGVRTAAIVGLIRHGGLDGMLYAAEHLRKLLEHEEPGMRKIGARIVGQLGIPSFYRPLQRLFHDPKTQVRMAAIEAAGRLGSPQLLEQLMEALQKPKVAMTAARALVVYGEKVLPRLHPLLSDDSQPEVQLASIRVCRLLGGANALSALDLAILSEHRETRLAALRAMQKTLRRESGLKCNEPALKQHLMYELQQHYQLSTDREVLARALVHHELLIEAIDERLKAMMAEIFLVLGLLYPEQQCDLIYRNLQSQDKRIQSNAIELLDNFLSQDIRKALLPLLEDEYSHSGTQMLARPEPLAQILERLSKDPDSWLQAAMLWAIAENELEEQRPLVERAASHPVPYVRETAYVALRALLPVEVLREALQKALEDPSELVTRYAQSQLSSLPTSH